MQVESARGDRGEEVKELQRLLGIKDDGVFGRQTEGALVAYQSAGVENLSAPIHLGANQRFATELIAAAEAENFNPLIAAAFIKAEAATNPDGTWRVDSLNPGTQAAGLGQFIPNTWMRMARRPGTALNERATSLGYIENGQVINESAILALRTSEQEVGLMFRTMMELNSDDYNSFAQQQKGGVAVIPNGRFNLQVHHVKLP